MTMDGNITQTKFHRMQNEGAIFLSTGNRKKNSVYRKKARKSLQARRAGKLFHEQGHFFYGCGTGIKNSIYRKKARKGMQARRAVKLFHE